jgi:hypothetical protein
MIVAAGDSHIANAILLARWATSYGQGFVSFPKKPYGQTEHARILTSRSRPIMLRIAPNMSDVRFLTVQKNSTI